MKKLILLIVAVWAMIFAANAQERGAFFVGGTAGIGYSDYFEFNLEPVFGYEIKDWVAVGTGLGMSITAGDYIAEIAGIVEPFVRFTPWHNDLVYIDLKATAAWGFDDELIIAQMGVRPGIRFRLTDHFDIAADLGLFGAQCIYGDWRPAFGLSGTAAGLWAVYRF